MNRISALSLELLLISFCAFNASAQYHPGSAGYNTVVVPGNSLGKFGTGSMNSWGAFSQGSGGAVGWTTGARSEREARRAALADCVRNGGTECEVEGTFVNSCGAVAFGPENWSASYAPPQSMTLHELEAKVLGRCGAECEIVRSGCSL